MCLYVWIRVKTAPHICCAVPCGSILEPNRICLETSRPAPVADLIYIYIYIYLDYFLEPSGGRDAGCGGHPPSVWSSRTVVDRVFFKTNLYLYYYLFKKNLSIFLFLIYIYKSISKSFLNLFIILDFLARWEKIPLQQLIIHPPNLLGFGKNLPLPRKEHLQEYHIFSS
jgi:hypothetical protein